MNSLQELAQVKYVPQLNLKTTEETHDYFMKLNKRSVAKKMDFDAYYINIVEEFSKSILP
jgi:hypothetical protein